MLCPIWGTKAEEVGDKDFDGVHVQSSRAGGAYKIAGTALGLLPKLSQENKALLTSWLIAQRKSGFSAPLITSDTLDLIRSQPRLKFSERIVCVLQALDESIKKVGDYLRVMQDGDDEVSNRIMAVAECQDGVEMTSLIYMMGDMGLLDVNKTIGAPSLRPTARGWQKIEELGLRETDSAQAFVAMWFSDSTTNAYEKGIRPAIEEVGYKPLRIDAKHHINKIDDEIIAEIRRSRFLVADFTCEPEKVRGGVYFEAGFAKGLNIPVFWTCKDTSLSDLHFDTRQYAHIAWKDEADLRKQLKDRIGAVLGDGPLKRS